jgi:hypothetical protein
VTTVLVYMLRITDVKAEANYAVWLRFSDGSEGKADLSHISRTGVFTAWNDPDFFAQVRLDPDSGTVSWPGEIDLDPYVLYSRVTGKPIEDVLELV